MGAIGIVITAAVAIFIGYLLQRVGSNKDASTKPQLGIVPKSEEQIKEILEQIGVQVENKKENEYLVKYQGGTFFFNYNPQADAVCLVYPNFGEFKFEVTQQLMMAANHINNKSVWWVCYLNVADTGEQENPVTVSLSYTASLMGEQQAVVGMLKRVMQFAFSVARDFHDTFNKDMQDGTDWSVVFTNNDFQNRMAYVRNRLEVGHGDVEQEQIFKKDALELLALLKLYEDIDWGCPRVLRIMVDGEYKTVEDVQEMMKFDVMYFIKHQCASHPMEASIWACFEHCDLQINLRQIDGATEKTLFYQLSLNRIGHFSDRFDHNPDSYLRNTLIEVRLTDSLEDYWEAKFMIDDARDKQKAGKYGELSDEQKMVLALSGDSMRFDLYWGKKYYNAKCYYQALIFFRRIFFAFRRNWKDVREEEKNTYFEICYYMGFIYMEMNLREKAFYYLTTAKELSNIENIQEYINCLCNMHDPLVMDCIKSYMRQTVELLNGEQEGNENFIRFYNFLNRRLAYMLIELKEFDEAERFLNDMIKNGVDVDFAKEELEYIKSIREKI